MRILGRHGGNDLKTVYVAHDERYCYGLHSYSPGNPFTSHENVFIDADNDATLGIFGGRPFGSELLIQSGRAIRKRMGLQRSPDQRSGLGRSANGCGHDFEFRIARSATYASDNTRFFLVTIAILLRRKMRSSRPWTPRRTTKA
jgi:hypothetical protein